MTERLVRWGKLRGDLPIRKAHYTDAQFRAFVTILCQAILQDSPVFRNRRQVEALIGRRMADHLFSEEDLLEADGAVLLVGWEEHQGAVDRTAAERKRRQRARDAATRDGTRDVTRDSHSDGPISSVTSTSSTTTTNGEERGSGGEEFDMVPEIEALTGRPWAYRPGSVAFETLRYDVRDFGPEAVRAAMRRVTSGGPVYDAAALVMAAHRIVQPIPDVAALAKAERADRERAEAEARHERAVAATRRRQADLEASATAETPAAWRDLRDRLPGG